MSETLVLGVIILISAGLLSWMQIRLGPKDNPDGERKNQAYAVPTSGGLAIAIASMLVPAIVIFISAISVHDQSLGSAIDKPFEFWRETGFLSHIMLMCFVLLLGAVDDARTVPTRLKFALLAAAALLAASFGINADKLFLPLADSTLTLAAWIAIIGTALWIFVMMNATNFMDGSNGIAMGTLAIMLGAVALHDLQEGIVLCLAIAAAILGFLVWNLQGKLYAGDAGALFGGAAFACLSLYTVRDGNIWFPATLALPFLVDVFMTLIWRARRGHNLLSPHRHHAYQQFIKAGWGHLQTAALWWLFALICASVALWASADSKAMSAFVFIALLTIGCALWLVQRRRAPSVET